MSLRWHLNIVLFKTAVGLLRLTGWYNGYFNHWRTMFDYAQRKGLHILPVHYYSPIPNTRELPDELWQRKRIPLAFDLNEESAFDLLERFNKVYAREYKTLPSVFEGGTPKFYLSNSAYSSGDAEILYSMVRDLKPRKIIELGSGYSTLLICQAIRENQREVPDYQCEFVAIEPYPPSYLSPLPAEVTRLESKPLQQVNSELFSSLGANDLLFIDSTHVARIGSDVIHEYLVLVPSLAVGVVVHIHDIFIPAEYPRIWIDEARYFWNEQYLVEAFLSYNSAFEVIMPTHHLWLKYPERFHKSIPVRDSIPFRPSSFWIRRIH